MKRILAIAMALLMVLSFAACGGTSTGDTVNVSEESEGKVTVGAGVVNPMHSATQESLLQDVGISFQIPAGAEEVSFYLIDTDPKTAQMSFVFDGDEYTYRISPTAEYKDISGMYYTWEQTEKAEIDYNEADVCWNDWKEGVIMWYDMVPGLMYSLSQGTNANYNSLEGMANTLYTSVQGDVSGDAEAATATTTTDSSGLSADFMEAFNGTLKEFHENLQLGTAGSSLKSAIFAGRFMDLLTEDMPDTEIISDAVKAYADTLSEDELAIFKEQLQSLKSSAEALNNGSSGETLLESCGYEALYAPWDAKAMAKYFDAMVLE